MRNSMHISRLRKIQATDMKFFKVLREENKMGSYVSWHSKSRTRDRRETISIGYVKGTARTSLLRRAFEFNFNGKRPMRRRRHWETARGGETCRDIERAVSWDDRRDCRLFIHRPAQNANDARGR
jgi:hypothetical protein